MGFVHNFGMFLLGLRDSLSLGWIKKLIFCQDPVTKELHPASKILRKSLAQAFIRIGLTLFIIPLILTFLGIDSIAFLLRCLFLILGYGYIFFYNQDIISSVRKIINFRRKEMNESHFQLDKVQKIDPYFYLSGVIKGVLFLVLYYVPIVIITTLLTYIPYFGILTVIISQAFFNAAFFFLTAWPYDNYNAAFLQQQKYYMLGYGMFVSILCNYFLSGFTSLGVCMIISLWMLINTVVFGPVLRQDQQKFKSFGQIWTVLTNSQARSSLKNPYNIHRQKLKNDKTYGPKIVKSVFLVKPALIMTQIVNNLIGKYIFKNTPQIQPNNHQS